MRRARWIAALAVLALLVPGLATAADGKWQANTKLLLIIPNDGNDANAAASLPSDSIGVSDEWTLEIDFRYWFNPKWAVELVLAKQAHEVELAGVGKLGYVEVLPPTLSLQYHFSPGQKIQPYLQAGLNLTFFTNDDLDLAGLDIDDSSFGPAVGGGIDFLISDSMVFNVDAKYAQIRADVDLVGGGTLTEVQIDPWLVSLGLGWRF